MPSKYLLSITEIEDKIKKIIDNLNKDDFIEDFLGAFDIPKTSITRAKSNAGDFFIKNKVKYRRVFDNPLLAVDQMEQQIIDSNENARYIIATDFNMFYAKDTKTKDTLAILINDLPNKAEFFLAFNGVERVDYRKENPADIKAAKRFTKLYDELIKINPDIAKEEQDGSSFNLFLIRSLFLFFCEDTEIISKGSFTNILKVRTEPDGSDLNLIIAKLFSILDKPEIQRENTPDWLKKFPYVNGKLFKEQHRDLNFNTLTRKLLIEAGELLNWNEINPDILGAMIQTVANKEERHLSGMHYTSVTNILKVIKPLFFNNLQEEYQKLDERAKRYSNREITQKQKREQQRNIIKDLNGLINKMSKIKFLDPACGSGNFLIVTYKELRRLEIQILVKIREIQFELKEKNVYQGEFLKESKIRLNQFFGIEIDDFAHEVAKLSLYIAEHQMNVEMIESLADYQPKILPLKESGNILHGNALLMDWSHVLHHEKDNEIYILGNPPYMGAKLQSEVQKRDLEFAISPALNYKKLDYISGWFYKATRFIRNKNAEYAFVTTNSINQGEQVNELWTELLKHGEISFAYQSFKWGNSAARNAGVTVSIIGFSNKTKKQKILFIDNVESFGENINPYLTFGENTIVKKMSKPLNELPEIVLGSKPVDFGHLIFTRSEYQEALENYPDLKNIFKEYIGAEDYINGNKKYALWFDDESYENFKENTLIAQRISRVREDRMNGGTSAKAIANTPHRFFTYQKFEQALKKHKKMSKEIMHSILVPSTSSEFRDYVPMGLVDEKVVISSSAMAIYDAPLWLLGVLESRMHMTWLRAIGGKLKTDYRYSAGMVYNTFPIPLISSYRKNILEDAVLDMLDIREEEGGTLADLYGGANKPMNLRLREAHEKIDGIVERAYKQEPFKSDEERLSVLLKLYNLMINEGSK